MYADDEIKINEASTRLSRSPHRKQIYCPSPRKCDAIRTTIKRVEFFSFPPIPSLFLSPIDIGLSYREMPDEPRPSKVRRRWKKKGKKKIEKGGENSGAQRGTNGSLVNAISRVKVSPWKSREEGRGIMHWARRIGSKGISTEGRRKELQSRAGNRSNSKETHRGS